MLPSHIQNTLDELRYRIEDREINQSDVANSTGINQSQISRILNGKISRVSKNVERLCKYANSFSKLNQKNAHQKDELVDTLLNIWDGSTEQASIIKELLLVVDSLQSLKKRGTKGNA